MTSTEVDDAATSTAGPVPFTVIGGFLGAGKTTLVNHLLRHGDIGRVALLVNDFGQLNIDADLIERHDGDTISLTNGCMCCAFGDDLASLLPSLLERHPPLDRVVVEASGIADPGAVAQYGTWPGFRLDGVITMADAETIRQRAADRRLGPQVLEQLRRADLVVLNKVDLIDDHHSVVAWLHHVIPDVRVVTTDHGRVSPEVLLGAGRRFDVPATAPSILGVGPSLEPGHGFGRGHLSFDTPIDRRQLAELLDALPPSVLRAKGILRLADHPDTQTEVQLVGRRRRVRRHGERAIDGHDDHGGHLVLIADGPIDAGLLERLAGPLGATWHPGSP